MSLHDGRKKTGYSVEEAYFHKENQRLSEELRKKNTQTQESVQGVVIDASARFEQRREDRKDDKKKAA
ncbi:MAG: hypothetical protein ABIR96_02160 [Bdellovibrionota bacterium]